MGRNRVDLISTDSDESELSDDIYDLRIIKSLEMVLKARRTLVNVVRLNSCPLFVLILFSYVIYDPTGFNHFSLPIYLGFLFL